ncbi:MAG: TIGR00730 family Rossman fold protein [Dehalococcoidia bacterium]|nr:TIGR00730 family Rossman fold protein [Dehalococcoidia bacterium]MDZ4346608.1 TIGR00730 family Rossman fold protein [Candidatus Binatia bacterium]
MSNLNGRICVFTGSKTGKRSEYRAAARQAARQLVERGYGLVYGGGNVGLMGVIADAVLERGGHVTGVIPDALVSQEVAHRGLSELRVVQSMHERKAVMADLSDGFIAMPGGIGTMEEFFEVLSWAQLGLHNKPCGLLNIGEYYDHLIRFMNHAVDQEFLKPKHRALLIVEEEPSRLLDRFEPIITANGAKRFERSRT